MGKLLELAGDLGKTLLPAAADLAKLGLKTGGKLAGKLGRRALDFGKGEGGIAARRFTRKKRKLLRKTAILSGCVLALSVAGLVMGRKK